MPFRGCSTARRRCRDELTARLIREYCDRGRRRCLPSLVSGENVELTTREFEVLGRLRKGASTAAIAGQLRITEVTVRRHISAIMRKLGAPDRRTALELLALAEDAGLEQPARPSAQSNEQAEASCQTTDSRSRRAGAAQFARAG